MSKSSTHLPSQATDLDDERPKYSVPALEKGLDILELLATRSEGLTQSAIAAELSEGGAGDGSAQSQEVAA